MYVLILILVPFLFLFNTYLAMGGLIAAIVFMCVERTKPSKRQPKLTSFDSDYKPGYDN